MRKTLLTIIILTLAVFSTNASPCNHGSKMDKSVYKSLMEDYKAYYRSDILPSMLEWKARLDNNLTAQDLASLNEMRSEANEFKSKLKQKFLSIKGGSCGLGEKGCTDEDKMAMQKNVERMNAIFQATHQLAEKYQSIIDELSLVAEPKTIEWKEKSKEIFMNWSEKNKEAFSGQCGYRKGMRRMNCGVGSGLDFSRKNKVVLFMLWDGTDNCKEFAVEQNPALLSVENTEESDQMLPKPNPFNDATTITFNLQEEDFISVKVLDNSGKTVAVLHNGTLAAGQHSFIFDANNTGDTKLPSGTYLYTVEGRKFNTSGKMLLQR